MKYKIRLPSLPECVVFFDFDNTISHFDVLDDIISRFSINNEWERLEKLWEAGKIGSKECLEGQLRQVRITRRELSRYLSEIKIDPYFDKLIATLKHEGIKPVILSDNFSFIIKSVLENNGITGLKIYSNKIKFYKDRIVPSFPYSNRFCKRCAHCKRKQLLKNNIRDKIIIYIGDGNSDICPAENSDIVFAKGSLLDYLRKKRRLCLAFKDLKDIYEDLRRLE